MMRIWPGGQKTGGRNVCVSMAMLWRLLMSFLSPSTLQLPLSGTKRPYWDVELFRSMGFGEVHAEFDLTERLWDEKERLLYGETPMFGVFATKF